VDLPETFARLVHTQRVRCNGTDTSDDKRIGRLIIGGTQLSVAPDTTSTIR